MRRRYWIYQQKKIQGACSLTSGKPSGSRKALGTWDEADEPCGEVEGSAAYSVNGMPLSWPSTTGVRPLDVKVFAMFKKAVEPKMAAMDLI